MADFFPKDRKSIILQSLYLAQNPNPLAQKREYSKAPDGSTYSDLHEKYHGIYSKYVKRFGFLDIYLVDIESGHVVFNISKEIDFATNLITGPLKDTNLAATFKAIQKTADENFVKLQDFSFYDPSYGIPTSFIGTPIYEKGKKVGALIFQLPIDIVNNIMTYNKRWQDVGLGQTGEAVLIGSDAYMRTLSRFFIEDQQSYLKKLRDVLHVETQAVDKMQIYGTTILLREIDTAAAQDITQGITNTRQISDDYLSGDALAAYAPLDIKDVKWGIIAKIGTDEVFAPIKVIAWRIILWALAAIFFIIIFTLVFLYFFTKQIETILSVFKQPTINLRTKLPITSSDEFGEIAKGYNDLLAKIATIMHSIKTMDDDLIIMIESVTTTGTHIQEHTDALTKVVEDSHNTSQETKKTLELYGPLHKQFGTGLNSITEQVKRAQTDAAGIDAALQNIREKADATQKISRDTQNETKTTFDCIKDATREIETIKQALLMLTSLIEQSTDQDSSALKAHLKTIPHATERAAQICTNLKNNVQQHIKDMQNISDATISIREEVSNATHTTARLKELHDHITDDTTNINKTYSSTTNLYDNLYKQIENIVHTDTDVQQATKRLTESIEQLKHMYERCESLEKQLQDALKRIHL